MSRALILSTLMGGIMAIEKIIKIIPLDTYEHQRLEDALFYLNGIYNIRKNEHKYKK